MKNNRFLFKTFYVISGLAFLLITAGSCSKDNSVPASTYQMTFTANGTKVSYTPEGGLIATFSNTGDQYLGVFSGSDANTNMNLQVFDNKMISAIDYTGYTTSGFQLIGVLIGYDDNSGTLYSEAGDDAEVNVTSMTATEVSGTFSGTLTATGKPELVIADGKFTLKRY